MFVKVPYSLALGREYSSGEEKGAIPVLKMSGVATPQTYWRHYRAALPIVCRRPFPLLSENKKKF